MPNSNQNYFQQFSLPKNFDLDADLIEKKYLELQKKFHPDNLINKSSEDQSLVKIDSIAVNEAYEILKSPLKRAIYLLKLNGINIDDDRCFVKPDQETLILILELKEKLFGSYDVEEDLKVKAFAINEIKNLMDEIKIDFQNKKYELAAKKLIKVKYLDKILLDIKLKNKNPISN